MVNLGKQMETYKKFLDEFEAYPDQIREQEFKVLSKEQKGKELLRNLKNRENKIMTDILNQTEQGKPVYSNKEKRDAELLKRKGINKEFIELEEEYNKNEYDLAEAKIELNFLNKQFSRSKYFINFLNAIHKD